MFNMTNHYRIQTLWQTHIPGREMDINMAEKAVSHAQKTLQQPVLEWSFTSGWS